MSRGAILDRALEPSWMDLAMEAARGSGNLARAELERKLRDRIPAPEGRKKTVRVIARVWLNPSPEIAPMISWALERAPGVNDSRVLHLGGLMAAYPFFGRACAIVGRSLGLDGHIDTGQLRQSLKKEWGTREIVDVSSRGVIRTLRAFGILSGGHGDERSELENTLTVAPSLTHWVTHALLLTRGADESDRRTIQAAPELFMFELKTGWREPYPMLERFTDGGSRLIFRLRRQVGGERSGHSQSGLFRG